MKKVLVIYNPVSGAKKFRASPHDIQQHLLKKNIDYTWFETIPARHQPFKNIISEKFDLIIAVGGDGTIREVAHYLIQNKLSIPLAIIAQGSANLLATSLGIPIFPPMRALNFALTKSAQPLDVMHVNNKHFALIAAGQGYDALFIKGATRRLKRQFGFFAYIYSFLRTFFTYRNRKFKIIVDGKHIKTAGKLAIVFNLISISGIPIHDKISPQDGIVDLAVLSPRSLLDLLKIIILFPFRRHLTPKVQLFHGKHIVIQKLGATEIQLDGEIYPGKQLEIHVIQKALQIIYEKKFAQ